MAENSAKLFEGSCVAEFPNQLLAPIANPCVGTFAGSGASMRSIDLEGVRTMFGKLGSAWLGEKVAGPNSGTKGAIIGYGIAAVARRSVPALAAIALGGWAFRKLRDRRRATPSYPSDSSPAS